MSSAADTQRIHAVLDEHAPIQAQRERRRRRLGRGERVSAGVLGGAFLAVAVPLAILVPTDRTPSTLLYLALICAYAAAWRLDFEVGSGFSVPTQLLLVPMLFTFPLRPGPTFVAAANVVPKLIPR